jgi:translation elongation factor EF-1beta
MKALEAAVRGIEKEGLVWGSSKLVAVGFGIKKLQITLVIEDDKIGLTELEEEIAEFEDYVQSSDVVSFITCRTCLQNAYHYTGCYAKVVEIFLFLLLPPTSWAFDLTMCFCWLLTDFRWDD